MNKYVPIMTWLLASYLAVASAQSYAVTCTGKVQELGLVTTSNDHILVQIGTSSWNTGLMRHCSLTTTKVNVSPEQCVALYSMLLSAKASDKNIRIDHAGDSCDQLGSWDVPDPAPFHFFLAN